MSSSTVKPLFHNPMVDVIKIKTERNGLGVLKTGIVLLLILVQLSVFILSYLYVASFFTWFSVFSVVMSFLTCIYVLSTNKNSQSKPIWVLFLLTCSMFGYFIYFLSSEQVFWGKRQKRYTKILENSYKHQAESVDLSKTNNVIKTECKYLQTAGNFSAYNSTNTKYLPSGTKFYDSLLEDLKSAKDFIFLEFFIVSDGILLKRVLNVLEEKVKQGVDVRLIYDDFGSHSTFSRRTKKYIKKLGIKLYSFNKLLPRFTILLNYRDHRKIVIIDGKVAYTGGVNLADEYVNEKRSHGYWKDCGVRLEGSAVDGLTLIFLRQWEFVSKQTVDYTLYLNKYSKTENLGIIVPYADGLEYVNNIGKNVYTNLISNANQKLYIMSPYFVVDDTITNLLINKAKAGVDVRIVLPEIADKKIVYIISRNNAEKLIEHGVKVYTLKNSFVHSKVVLTENSAVIGSINMDLRSFYQQFESAVYLTNSQTLEDINKDLLGTFNNSVEITKANKKRNKLSFRIIAGLTNLISPFM